MNMIININDGSITIENNLLRKGDGIEKIRSAIGKEIDRNDVKNGWIHYIYRNIKLLDFYPISVVFSLENNKLNYLSMGYNGNEKSISDLKARHEEIAEKISQKKPTSVDNFGLCFVFSWGKISSSHDIRTEFSQIILSWN